MLRRIYSAIYGEFNVSVSDGYVLQYAGGTPANMTFCFCHFNKLVRSEKFGTYYVYVIPQKIF